MHDIPKVARSGCRLPIGQATVELIATQKRAVQARYPDTAASQLRLFPRPYRNPHGTIPISPEHVSRIMRLWVNALPALVDLDGSRSPASGSWPTPSATATRSVTPTTAPRSKSSGS